MIEPYSRIYGRYVIMNFMSRHIRSEDTALLSHHISNNIPFKILNKNLITGESEISSMIMNLMKKYENMTSTNMNVTKMLIDTAFENDAVLLKHLL
jgi:hypothetical protein